MKQVDRIRKMESIMDNAKAAIDRLDGALEEYNALKKDIDKLAAYYESQQWLKDFTDDEKGKLPTDLKRGVLSEDGVYDLLEDERELIGKLLKTVNGYIK
ncbi:MAG: DUF4298 domain-containing protein [Erysipelotrichaceae bacterium]|nr:DUF4298 domain-containing protein [Erysipelotrichaceae bacterium]